MTSIVVQQIRPVQSDQRRKHQQASFWLPYLGMCKVFFSSITFVALCGWAAKADDSIVCFGAKPDKGFLDMKSRRIRKWEGDAREAVDGGPGRGSWRRDPAEGSWRLDSREANSREQLAAWHRSREARQHGIGSSDSESRRVSRCLHWSCL